MDAPPRDGPAGTVSQDPSRGWDGWLTDEHTAALLESLQPTLAENIEVESPLLGEIISHLIQQGGKRIRPCLVFLAGSFGNATNQDLLHAAAAIELTHVASLYHDDVMDRALDRRGAPSANRRWGNTLAVLGGSYLLGLAIAAFARLGDSLNQLVGKAVSDVCAGQLHEMETAYSLEVTDDEHLDILTRKTAALFELPCRVGALLGGLDDERSAALSVYGRSLGLAFQLIDDALDVSGDPHRMGKPTGTDIRQGTYGLAVLRTARLDDERGRRVRSLLALDQLGSDDLDEVLRLVRNGPAPAQVTALAQKAALEAARAIGEFPETDARSSLLQLASFVVTRAS